MEAVSDRSREEAFGRSREEFRFYSKFLQPLVTALPAAKGECQVKAQLDFLYSSPETNAFVVLLSLPAVIVLHGKINKTDS